jgi:hypothetical protein
MPSQGHRNEPALAWRRAVGLGDSCRCRASVRLSSVARCSEDARACGGCARPASISTPRWPRYSRPARWRRSARSSAFRQSRGLRSMRRTSDNTSAPRADWLRSFSGRPLSSADYRDVHVAQLQSQDGCAGKLCDAVRLLVWYRKSRPGRRLASDVRLLRLWG